MKAILENDIGGCIFPGQLRHKVQGRGNLPVNDHDWLDWFIMQATRLTRVQEFEKNVGSRDVP